MEGNTNRIEMRDLSCQLVSFRGDGVVPPRR